jgi:hypothetical protein
VQPESEGGAGVPVRSPSGGDWCGARISLGASVTLDDNIVVATAVDCAVTAAAGGGTLSAPSSPVNQIPEPGTSLMLASGLLVIVFVTLRKRKTAGQA